MPCLSIWDFPMGDPHYGPIRMFTVRFGRVLFSQTVPFGSNETDLNRRVYTGWHSKQYQRIWSSIDTYQFLGGQCTMHPVLWRIAGEWNQLYQWFATDGKSRRSAEQKSFLQIHGSKRAVIPYERDWKLSIKLKHKHFKRWTGFGTSKYSRFCTFKAIAVPVVNSSLHHKFGLFMKTDIKWARCQSSTYLSSKKVKWFRSTLSEGESFDLRGAWCRIGVRATEVYDLIEE
jgi:hypothetical protein